MNGPSPHFDWSEFACHDYMSTAYPEDLRETCAVVLANELERLRAWLSHSLGRDCPVFLTSVFRTMAYNAAIGGKPKSQHLHGRAADVPCPHGCTYDRFREGVLSVAHEPDSMLRYVCFYPNQGFAHLDTRPTKTLVEDKGV
jgi:uncharacterized protein YcbK (DUF882 family)